MGDDFPDREALGREVRRVWIECAGEALDRGDDVPPRHLLEWEDLDEWNREVDRRIGEAVAWLALTPLWPRLLGLLGLKPDDIEMGAGAGAIVQAFREHSPLYTPEMDEAFDDYLRTAPEVHEGIAAFLEQRKKDVADLLERRRKRAGKSFGESIRAVYRDREPVDLVVLAALPDAPGFYLAVTPAQFDWLQEGMTPRVRVVRALDGAAE